MRILIQWLKEYVDIKIPVRELSDKLTMAGTENEILSDVGADPGIVVGEVLEINAHPNADRLQVTKMNIGTKNITVVVGCPHNLEVGMKVPVVLAGTELPDGTKAMKVDLRGVTSEGMFRSEMELGISEHNSGIMVLESDAPIGASLDSVLKKDTDILEAELTPNRGDCLSMIGIAREVAVIKGGKLKLPKIQLKEAREKASDLISVEIKDKDLCRRYIGRVIKNVKIGDSPKWMQERLAASGVRPINNVVDVTNYVMLEMGQPLHAFDADKVSGGKIVVRRAKKGERIETLDGVNRELSTDDLVIADSEKAIGIAGVMGGANSEIDDNTEMIVLESANFNPVSIRKTAFRLGLRSEASARFEKGLSLQLAQEAADRAAALLAEVSGGEVLQGKIDVGEKEDKKIRVSLRFERIKSFLGEEIAPSEAISMLERLGFETIGKDKEKAEFIVPSWRLDVSIEEDLLEEIARVYGYDKIQTTMPEGAFPTYEKNEKVEISNKIRGVFKALGFFEVYSYSFTSKEKAKLFRKNEDLVKIANPMSQEQEYMRVDLLGSLLEAVVKNKDYKIEGAQGIYEIACVYLAKEQKLKLSGLVYGGSRQAVFNKAKGTLSALLDELGLDDVSFSAESEKEARILAGKAELGHFVILDSEDITLFKLKSKSICFFEMDVVTLAKLAGDRKFRKIPKFPASERDLTFILDEKVKVDKIYAATDEVASDTRISREVVDIYRGKELPEGKKSVSLRFTYRSMERTLTDEEVDDDQKKIINRANNLLGGQLRGGKEE